MQRIANRRSMLGQLTNHAVAGEMVFAEGEDCEHVYELRHGIARGVSFSIEGDRQITAFFFPGDQIGLPVAEHYRFTAEAVTGLRYICYSKPCWHEALVRSCREEGRLLPSICSEQDPVFRRGLLLGRPGVLARLSAFLISIVGRLSQDGLGRLMLPLPQVDMAAYLAISPESVCRAYRRLRELQIIDVPRRDRPSSSIVTASNG